MDGDGESYTEIPVGETVEWQNLITKWGI